MIKRANIVGLAKAIQNVMIKSAAPYFQAPVKPASSYMYDNPINELGYHYRTQNGNIDDTYWNFVQDTQEQGMSQSEIARRLNMGRAGYQGFDPYTSVNGNDYGIDVRIPTHEGDSYQSVDLNSEPNNYAIKQYRKKLMDAEMQKLVAQELTPADKQNLQKGYNIYQGVTKPFSGLGLKPQIANQEQFNAKRPWAMAKHNIAPQVASYKKQLKANPIPRMQYTGPTSEYASTAVTAPTAANPKGGRMGMTVDPLKTRQNLKNVNENGPVGRVKRNKYGMPTLNYKGKHGGISMRINRDGTTTYVS